MFSETLLQECSIYLILIFLFFCTVVDVKKLFSVIEKNINKNETTEWNKIKYLGFACAFMKRIKAT